MKTFINLLLIIFVAVSTILPQSAGDYQSKTGSERNWGTASNWDTWNGSAWVTASSVPGSTNNVTIRGDSYVKIEASGKSCLNLTVENNGELYSSVSSVRTLNVYGSIICDGIFGNAAALDGISLIMRATNCSISGFGNIDINRIDKGGDNSTTNLTISANINLRASAGTSALRNYQSANTNFNITIEAGKALNIVSGWASLDGQTGDGISDNGGTLTVDGSFIVGGTLYAGTTDNTTNPVNIIIGNGGTIDCGGFWLPSSGSAGSSLTMYANSLLKISGASSYGSVNNNCTLNNSSTVEYASTTGDQDVLPLTYGNLTISGTYTKVLTGSTTANGKVTLYAPMSVGSGPYSISYGSSANLEYQGTATFSTSNAEWPATFDKNILINSSGKLTLNGDKTYNSRAISFTAGEFDVSTYQISGTGSFNMTGATKIYTSHANGIGTTGNFQLSGTQTFSTSGSYEYNSNSAHQYTGNSLPSTVSNLILYNTKYAGEVFLSSGVTVSSLLTRRDGILNLNGNTLTYGASASLLYDNGTTDLTVGDEFPSTMSGTTTLSGSGVISLENNNEINNTFTVNEGSVLRLWGNHILTLNGNVVNNGTIYGEGNINYGGESFSNGATASIDPTGFNFTRTGIQTISGLSKFHNTVSITLNSGAIVGFGDGETLNLGYGVPFTIASGGRLNISGTVTIIGEGYFYDYGTLYINSLSTLIISGLRLNVYNNQINGSDGTLQFEGTSTLQAVNGGSLSGGSLNLNINSGTTTLDRSATNITTINGGFNVNSGATFSVLSYEDLIFNSEVVNAGTIAVDVHGIFDFKGSNITNTGTITAETMYFNNNGIQAVHGLAGINVSSDIKVKGMTGLNLSNTYSTPSQQVLTIGASATFTVETDAQIVIDGDITFTGALGCSSIPNQVCGTFTKNGTLTINANKILRLTCGTVNIIGSNAIGSGTLGIGQATSTNNYLDETNLYFTEGMSINASTLTLDFLEGSCTNVWDKVLHTDGPVTVSGVLRSGVDCNHLVVGFIFNGDLTINANGKVGGVSCINGNWWTTQPFIVHGNLINAGSEYLDVNLNGTDQQSVSGNFSTLTINNGNGGLLTGNTTISETLTLTSGTINTGSNILTLGTSTSNRGTLSRTTGTIVGKLKRWFTNSTVNDVLFPVGTSSNYRPANISFTGAPSTGGTLTVTFMAANPGSTGLPLSEGGDEITACASEGCWSIETSDGFAGGTYNIDLTADGFAGVSDYTSLRLLKRTDSSSPWTLDGTHSAGTGSNSTPVLHRTGLTSFSEFGVGGGSSNPLPVELISFTASVLENKVTLNWSTATELNNYSFEIERASLQNNGTMPIRMEWEKIGFINGHGNSNSPKEYSFRDKSVTSGKFFYRLKQIDIDGKYKYSIEIEIEMKQLPTEYVLEQNYPNPFNPTTEINFSIPTAGNVKLVVYNSIGQQVTELLNSNIEIGNHKVNFDANNLSSGIYFYRISTGNFTKVKKMLVIK